MPKRIKPAPTAALGSRSLGRRRPMKKKKKKTRSMRDVLNDPRSLCPPVRNGGVVLGKARPVTCRSDLSWTLLKSNLLQQNNNESHGVKMTQALHVMHECFVPSVDPVTNKEIASDVIFNEERDFYTAVLEKGDKVVAVANVRVHDHVAEAPLVATAFEYQKQGLCKVLMGEVESWLKESGVERLVLPSMESTVGFWTNGSMGYEEMTEDEIRYLPYDLLDFQGTVMCQKQLNYVNKEKKKKKIDEKCNNGRSLVSTSTDGSTITQAVQSSKVAISGFSAFQWRNDRRSPV